MRIADLYYICVKNITPCMTSTRLQDDLLQNFKEERKVIYEQIELLDPLGTSLRKPAAQRVLSKGALIFAEVLFYLLSLGTVAACFFLNKIYPFYIISEMRFKSEYRHLNIMDRQFVNISQYVLLGIIAILFYIIARSFRQVRLKNSILNLAGKNIKIIVGQHLKLKASIDAIEQRHFLELPNDHLEHIPDSVKVNEVPNPGYDEQEEQEV